MDNKPRDKVEITHCKPGFAEGYHEDFEYRETLIIDSAHQNETVPYTRLWVAVIRESLNDIKNFNPESSLHRQQLESFRWLFRDKTTFPAVAELLGYDYRILRKNLIKFVRMYKRKKF